MWKGCLYLEVSRKKTLQRKMTAYMGPEHAQIFKSCFLIYMYAYISLCLCAQVHAGACRGQKKAPSPEAGVPELQGSCECWEPSSSGLQKQPALFNISLAPCTDI